MRISVGALNAALLSGFAEVFHPLKRRLPFSAVFFQKFVNGVDSRNHGQDGSVHSGKVVGPRCMDVIVGHVRDIDTLYKEMRHPLRRVRIDGWLQQRKNEMRELRHSWTDENEPGEKARETDSIKQPDGC
jgi:hypothetical protein